MFYNSEHQKWCSLLHPPLGKK